MLPSPVFVLLALLLAGSAGQIAAQTSNVTWTSGPSGPAVLGAAMAYDAAPGRDELVLFGGNTPSGPSNKTWTYSRTQSAWICRLPPQPLPARRVWHGMVYDSARQVVVLFGGMTPSNGGPPTLWNDIWEWNGTNWMPSMPQPQSPLPPVRHSHAMCYDEQTGWVIVFGGEDTTGVLNDTWAWSAATRTWLPFRQSQSWPSVQLGAMAYDCARDCGVLVQRSNSTATAVTTWEWRGTSWTQPTPQPAAPGARWLHNVAYDRVRQRVVLFGGNSLPSPGTLLNDTWEWDGGTWTLKLPSARPTARRGHAMAYDEMRERVVVVGGKGATTLLPTTYEYQSLLPASFTSFGTGCGAVTLEAARLCSGTAPSNRDLPWIGDTFTVEMGGVPTASIALLAAGLTTPVPPCPIPGFPGCNKLINPITVLLRLPTQTTVGWNLGIPAVPGFVGVNLYLQGAALQPGVLQVTPGGDARIGMR